MGKNYGPGGDLEAVVAYAYNTPDVFYLGTPILVRGQAVAYSQLPRGPHSAGAQIEGWYYMGVFYKGFRM